MLFFVAELNLLYICVIILYEDMHLYFFFVRRSTLCNVYEALSKYFIFCTSNVIRSKSSGIID